MITKTDVEQTLLAVDPATSPQDIERLWMTVSETMDTRNQEFYATMKEQYRQVYGGIPDSLTDEQIRNRAYMDAENSVRGQYLEPLTAQLVDDELEMEEQQEELHVELLMQDPDSWKGEDVVDLPIPQWASELASELWEGEPTRVWTTAARRVNLMDYLGREYPTGPGPLMDQWTAEIRQSVQDKAREMEALKNRR